MIPAIGLKAGQLAHLVTAVQLLVAGLVPSEK